MGDEAKPCVNDRVCEDDEYCAKPENSARGTCQPKEDMGGAPEGGAAMAGGDMGSGGMNQSDQGGQSAMGGGTSPMAGGQAGMGGMNENMMAGGGNMMNMQGGQPAAGGGQGQPPVVEFDTDRRGLVEFTESFEEGSMTETINQRVRFRFWSELPPAQRTAPWVKRGPTNLAYPFVHRVTANYSTPMR